MVQLVQANIVCANKASRPRAGTCRRTAPTEKEDPAAHRRAQILMQHLAMTYIIWFILHQKDKSGFVSHL
jgi:hypothetical protein